MYDLPDDDRQLKSNKGSSSRIIINRNLIEGNPEVKLQKKLLKDGKMITEVSKKFILESTLVHEGVHATNARNGELQSTNVPPGIKIYAQKIENEEFIQIDPEEASASGVGLYKINNRNKYEYKRKQKTTLGISENSYWSEKHGANLFCYACFDNKLKPVQKK